MLEMWETSLPQLKEFSICCRFFPQIFLMGQPRWIQLKDLFLIAWTEAVQVLQLRAETKKLAKQSCASLAGSLLMDSGVKGQAVIESEGRGIWESLQKSQRHVTKINSMNHLEKAAPPLRIGIAIVLVCCAWVTRGELGYLDGNRSHDVESYARALCTMLTFCWCARGPVRVPCTVRGRGFCLVKGVMVLHLCYSF